MAAKTVGRCLLCVVPAVLLAAWGVYAWVGAVPPEAGPGDGVNAAGPATAPDGAPPAARPGTTDRREHARRAMSEGFHPVWSELWDGRIGPGASVEEVAAATRPHRVERFGRFVMLSYQPPGFDVLIVVARDGRLVSAHAASCIWSHTFFDTMSEADRNEWAGAQSARDAPRQAEAGR